MTTQVMIPTKMGIAVASDTVLTIVGQDGAKKTLSNSRKIHELSSEHKILILSAGDVYVNNIPIELFVLRWARELKGAMASTRAYSEHFVQWLGQNCVGPNLTAEQAMFAVAGKFVIEIQKYLRYDLGEAGFNDIPDFWDEDFDLWYAADKKRAAKYNKLCKVNVDYVIQLLDDADDYPFFDLTAAAKALPPKEAGKIVDVYFYGKAISPTLRQRIIDYLPIALTKQTGYLTDSETQLSFVGYGSESFTPTITPLVIEAAAQGLVFGTYFMDKDIDGLNGASFYHPAQNRFINTFLRGIDPNIRNSALQDMVFEALNQTAEDQALSSTTSEKVRDLSQDWAFKYSFVEAVNRRLASYGDAHYLKLLETINAMDITSVAEIAESLAGIEILGAHNEDGSPSSGGLIEVATIDLQNGIKWHSRVPITR